jgi:hypothetical protein
MPRKSLLGALGCALVISAIGNSSANAAPQSLLLPQATAFSYVGRSCGGIQEQAFATGFDATGYPTGDVYMQTRCGGSGRGGGYHTTTYSAWASVSWDFAGGVRSSAKLTVAPTVSSAFSATDPNGDQVYNTLNAVNVAPSACTVANTTYCAYRAYLTVPVPPAPTRVTATQLGDEFQVSWTQGLANPAIITSSTITATPIGSTSPSVTATETGSASTGFVGPLLPVTTYQIIVVSTDVGGTSPPSTPITVATQAASIVPSAPTGVTGRWTAPDSTNDPLLASWNAAVPGDSPTDQYQITIRGSDGAGTFTQTVNGSTLTATFSVSDIPDWSVTVRAHNAAGWGPWSSAFVLGGN